MEGDFELPVPHPGPQHSVSFLGLCDCFLLTPLVLKAKFLFSTGAGSRIRRALQSRGHPCPFCSHRSVSTSKLLGLAVCVTTPGISDKFIFEKQKHKVSACLLV